MQAFDVLWDFAKDQSLNNHVKQAAF